MRRLFFSAMFVCCGACKPVFGTVDKVLVCTPPVGGFNSVPSRCRVTTVEGRRITVIAPVAPSDRVRKFGCDHYWRVVEDE